MERFTLRSVRAFAMATFLASFVAGSVGVAQPVNAAPDTTKVQCKFNGELEQSLNMPVYEWNNQGQQPKGVVLALHGLSLHGMSYDTLAKALVDEGYRVYSTDMRGYGRLTKSYPHEFCTDHDCKQKVDYEKSSQDITRLAETIRAKNPNLPLFVVGESLGGHMAVRIASKLPGVIDGIVLSAPAIKAHTFIDAHMPLALNEMLQPTNFHKQVSIMPYVKRYASDDPKIVDELVNDPLLRRKLSLGELLRSRSAVYKTLSYVPNIKPNLPLLVIQGTEDRCVKANAVELLTHKLHSDDTEVKMFKKRGHILIETAFIKPDTMDTLTTWLNAHTERIATTALVGGRTSELAAERPSELTTESE